MAIIEIITFPADESFIADPLKVGEAIFRRIVQLAACIGIYAGMQVEDQKTGYLIISWETAEHSKHASEQPVYPQLTDALRPWVSGDIDIQQVNFSADFTAVLGAPILELGKFKLKPGKTITVLIPVLEAIAATLDSMEIVIKPTVWGKSQGRPDRFILCVGWPSKQAHLDSVRSSQAMLDHIAKLREIVEPSAVHIHFEKYTPQ